jgi:hypothetical protein
MDCPICKNVLTIASAKMVFENDDTPDKETIAFNQLTMVCVNPNCSNFCGELENPKEIIEIIRQIMN